MQQRENELLLDRSYSDVSRFFKTNLASKVENLRNKKFLVIAAGGLAPGVSTVLQDLAHHLEGIAELYGLDYGFAGIKNAEANLWKLSAKKGGPKNAPIQTLGLDSRSTPGDMPLAMSRGKNFIAEASLLADFAIRKGFEGFIFIGGDGTIKGTQLFREIMESKGAYDVQIGHILKTVDGDGPGTSQPFGMSSATDFIRGLVQSKNAEIRSSDGTVINLIGCMGRGSGQLPLNAAASSRHVDFAIIPDISVSAKRVAEAINRIVKRNGEGANVLIAEGVEHIAGLSKTGFRETIEPLAAYLRENVHSPGSPTKVIATQWDYTQRSPVILNATDERLIGSMTHTALSAMAVKARAFTVIGPQRTLDLHRPLPPSQLVVTPEHEQTLLRYGYTLEEIKAAQRPRSFDVMT